MKQFENPWTVLGSRQIYQNNWIGLTEFDVINPNGGPGIYGKIHYKNIAVGVLPLDDALNTYLVGQYRFPLDQYSWEIPEGGGDPLVEPLESAKRELLEETGLEAKDWTLLLQLHLSNSVSDELAILYLARQLTQHTPMPEETEKLSIKKLPFEEVYRMMQQGSITDAMSVAVILQVKLMLLDGRISS